MQAIFKRILLPTILILIFALGLSFFYPKNVYSNGGTAITGWMWSDNIGWISMNCSNTASCAASNYGMSVDASGNITGYAWSDNIGWVSANPSDLAGCPSGSCTATINTTTGAFSGWFRALAGESAQAGAWDGWVSLSGTTPTYGPVLAVAGSVSGFAWGSNSVGWVDFSQVATTFAACARNTTICKDANTVRYIDNSCVNHDTTCPYAGYGYGCVSGACTTPPTPGPTNGTTAIWVKPALIHTGTKVKVYWNVTNVTASTCTVTGSNGDGAGWGGIASSTVTEQSSFITTQTTYTITCQGVVPTLTYTANAVVSLAPDFKEI